jgi:hypothetical protein
MSDKVDKDTQIKYLEAAHMIGFGLWWTVLLIGALLPEKDISETGRMWLVIVTMTYAVMVLAAQFWTGYSRKEREYVNADPKERSGRLRSLRSSAIFGFVFMLIFWLVTEDGHWTHAVLQALFFAACTSLVTYLLTLRKPRGRKSNGGV